jgi:hypothetical protein
MEKEITRTRLAELANVTYARVQSIETGCMLTLAVV